MNIDVAKLFVIVIAPVLALYAVYWGFVRPVILLKIREKIGAMNEEVFANMLGAAGSRNYHAYAVLRKRSRNARFALPLLTFSRILVSERDPQKTLNFREDEQVIAESSTQIRELDRHLSSLMFAALLANSPSFSIVGLCFAFASRISGWAKQRVDKLTERTWQATETLKCA